MPLTPDENARDIGPDLYWMQEALALARRSVGVASPNPAVGCVLVRPSGSAGGQGQGHFGEDHVEDRVVGRGFHEYDRLDHAEVAALKDAGALAQGSTAYVTLEPCSHAGRTGPCADALIAAGVRRVVAATGDPNPAVNGQGFARLRAAGVEVTVGVCEAEARSLNDGFARYVRTRLPFVTLKAALSLDGRIAPAPGVAPAGAPFMLTRAQAQMEVQRMRHASDALLTGIGTVLADNPRLTDRSGLPRRIPLLRVVLDSRLRLPLDSKLVQGANGDLLVFYMQEDAEARSGLAERQSTIAERRSALQACGVRVEALAGAKADAGSIPLAAVLRRLGELEITSVLLEAGSRLNTAALREQAVDKLSLFYAPVLLGADAVPFVEAEFQPSPDSPTVQNFGRDVRLEAYLREPWGELQDSGAERIRPAG
jgi:diaminohydroxyphosphoribosylaminopyrimidine deaminase/5-amino-6-(5-phosphoribosylamino)uracil reductase